MKQDLYDFLVSLPPPFSKHAAEKAYPTIAIASPSPPGVRQSKPPALKATQRDARRYQRLRAGLGDFPRADASPIQDEDDSDASSTFSSSSIVEPVSWPLLAYTSFLWWASAGEKSAVSSDEESDQDARLLLTDDDNYLMYPGASSRRSSGILPERGGGNQPQELAIITYFRRLTTQIFTVLSDAISRHDGDDDGDEEADSARVFSPNPGSDEYDEEEDGDGSTLFPSSAGDDPRERLLRSSSSNDDNGGEDDDVVLISSSDVAEMGLDPWSETDRAFVQELSAVWFRRKVRVRGARIRCCGVEIL
jgi:hypothetical protein